MISYCLFVKWAGCSKTAEPIQVLLGVDALGDLRNIVLHGKSPSPTARRRFDAAFAKLLFPHVTVISFCA